MAKNKMYRLSFDGQINASLDGMLPYCIVELKENVDANKLSKAVNAALVNHPTFKTKIVKKWFKYYLVENNKLPIIKEVPWDEPIEYGGEDTNEYPWIITCCDKRLLFTGAHAICDGMGVMRFLKDILNNYFGIESETIVDVNKTFEDSFKANAKKNAKAPFERRKQAPPVSIPLSMFDLDSESCEFYRVIISQNSIRELSNATETSSFALLSGIVAKALARVLNISEGNINVDVSVDLRAKYDSVTDRGFVLKPKLVYQVDKLKNSDLFLTSTALRSQLDLFMDKDNLDYMIAKEQKNNDLLNFVPAILKIAQKEYNRMLYEPRADIVYTHLVRLGFSKELEEKIEDFHVSGKKSATPLIVILGSNFGGNISLTFGECFKDRLLTKEFAKLLDEYNIPYKIEKNDLHGAILYKRK